MKNHETSHTNASGVFPDTLAIDESVPGAKDGTEYIKDGINEWWGFTQALLNDVGITPSGSTEVDGVSDLLDAIKKVVGGVKIQPITAAVAANAMTITLNPTYLDFRSTTLGSGAVNTRIFTPAIALTISSGSTLGTVNAIQSRIAVLAIDNAGTVELAAVNISGGNDLSETGLISTVAEGGAGAADSNNVIYSNTLRSNVTYRVVGYIESTQATAGAWAASPSTIQGYGGQAFAAMSSIGQGQTWQDVSGSRSPATTYYNTTGRPISISVVLTSSAADAVIATIGGVSFQGSSGVIAVGLYFSEIIPPGVSYSITVLSGTPTIDSWNELR